MYVYIFFSKSGDLQKVGSCLDRNWEMKKRMAPGCETAIISRIMAAIRPFAHGMCMAGAGGGGFLYVLSKDETNKKSILNAMKAFEVIGKINFNPNLTWLKHLNS